MVGRARHVHPGHIHAGHVHRGHVVFHGLGDSVRGRGESVAEDEATGTGHEAGRDQSTREERRQQQRCQPRVSRPLDRDSVLHKSQLSGPAGGSPWELLSSSGRERFDVNRKTAEALRRSDSGNAASAGVESAKISEDETFGIGSKGAPSRVWQRNELVALFGVVDIPRHFLVPKNQQVTRKCGSLSPANPFPIDLMGLGASSAFLVPDPVPDAK